MNTTQDQTQNNSVIQFIDRIYSLIDDSDGENEIQMEQAENDSNLLILVILLCSLIVYESSTIRSRPGKYGNPHRDRAGSIMKVQTWSDEMFHRQMRLCREDFQFLLSKIDRESLWTASSKVWYSVETD